MTGVSAIKGCVLGIETSCDETAAAVVAPGPLVVSSVVSSQVELHAPFGGVVPEVAGRAHLERLSQVIAAALERSGSSHPAGVAATNGPGLMGSLLVGISHAKALAMAWGVPFVGVNHLEGHLFASLLDHPDLDWPLVVLLVSGGHTILVAVERLGSYRVLGQTLDDAAGEAFDKVARYLGLGYPGGPAIDRAAREGDPTAFDLPRPLYDRGYDFSFSGLKTALVRTAEANPAASTEDLAASFQEAVVDVLVDKAVRAVRETGAMGLCLGGGVAANSLLRERVSTAAHDEGVAALVPSMAMCTDNAAMIAAAGLFRLDHLGPSPMSLSAQPNLFIG
ncbi:MAG: tRNA (adenosine(37)-N6)-threonylcarbamoyltransferase complex transferase subunit TsaD [Acidimicrobiales bacterium]